MASGNPQRLLERFLRYVQIDTTAQESAGTYPSCEGQWELGRLLVEELHAAGVERIEHTQHGLIYAWLAPSQGVDSVPVALLAHLDTSPETTGRGVKPQVVRNYAGGDIRLPNAEALWIREAENPELTKLRGCTLITTDGRTLLGADDKAGVAVIMEIVERLGEQPHRRHGPVRVLFTCDEEIGRGVEFVDLEKLGARVAYTLDGHGADEVDVETFSADLALIRVRGRNIHPSIAKGRMVNALRGAARFLERLPREILAPESTEGRQGFLHPYQIQGGVGEVTLRVLLRDFKTSKLSEYAGWLRTEAARVEAEFPGLSIDVQIQRQYRNLRDGLSREPRAVQFALEAYRRLGREPRETIVRGGTDGALLSERGLPTPNLSCGQHNPHSPLEWACLEEMEQAVQVVLELLALWSDVRE
ncbi:MAG: peptidase T [Pirellulaceae bacterium]|nr:MAG: peptidase T [Pirellulaceae bacterium]